MGNAVLRESYNFVRWRLVPVRKLGKMKSQFTKRATPVLDERSAFMEAQRLSELEQSGWTSAPSPDSDVLNAITEKYMPLAQKVVPTDHGHPHKNVVRPQDLTASDPVFQLAFSDPILGAANAYFGGKFSVASIQVMRSFPTQGDLRESQMWHRDYGDAKSLHFIMYLNDVLQPEDGPFGFINRQMSKKVGDSILIRRLSDAQIARETGSAEFETFYGRRGEAIFVDPAVCYHYGSRCKSPRTAVFITFNTHRPYTATLEPLGSHRQQAAVEARKVRPDLSPEYIDRILHV